MSDGGAWNRMVAVSLVLTPVLGTASAVVGPHYVSSDSEMLSAIAGDQRGWNASALLGLVALVTSLLVVLGFVQRLGSRAPVLRIVGASLAVAGVLGLAGLIATDLVKGQMAEQPDRASMVLLASRYASPSGVHWFYRMLIAYTLGFIVLGVALSRSRVVRGWESAAYGVGVFAAFALDAIPGGHDGFGLGTPAAGLIFLAASGLVARRLLASPSSATVGYEVNGRSGT